MICRALFLKRNVAVLLCSYTVPHDNLHDNTIIHSAITGLVYAAPDTLSFAVLDPEQSKRLSVSVPAFIHEQVIRSSDLTS